MEKWDEERWKSEIEEADVMVMTADIALHMLERAFITMKQIYLIIFDEAHHTKKAHAYNQIMSIHYARSPSENRPKIFGMTASPVVKRSDASVAINQLENSLCSKAYTADIVDLAAHITQPDEVVLYYDLGPVYDLPKAYLVAHEHEADRFAQIEKKLSSMLDICDELGPW
ncbi:Dicer-like protein 1 [Rhizophlyctis rosea]|nr:Dicer-like protein 1 [Rhizophlyctis rosea]